MKKIDPGYRPPSTYKWKRGLWDPQVRCGLRDFGDNNGEWVCGLQVKMDDPDTESHGMSFYAHESALNQVKFKCCSYQKDLSKIYIPTTDDGG